MSCCEGAAEDKCVEAVHVVHISKCYSGVLL
jgi:hypothetical protein